MSIGTTAIEDRIHHSNTNKELDELLENYKNGTISPDENATLIIHFKDQTQNIDARKIKAKYEGQKKGYREEIRTLLRERKSEAIRENSNLSTAQEKGVDMNTYLTNADLEYISQNTKTLKDLDKKARAESISLLSIKIKEKQKPFVELIKKKGGKILSQLEAYNGLVVRLPVKEIESILGNEEISSVYLNVVYQNVTLLDHSTYAIYANALWNDTNAPANGPAPLSTVAILDSGVDNTHPSLKFRHDGITERTWYERSFVDWDDNGCPDDNSDPNCDGIPENPVDDDVGHGTHVAGIVGSSSVRNGIASNDYLGVVYDIRTMIDAKIIKSTGIIDLLICIFKGGCSQLDDIEKAISWSTYNVADPADVLSNSWGSSGTPNGEGELARYVDAVVDNNDVIFVFSSGNSGPNEKTLSHPADAYNVITVGAVDDIDTATVIDSQRDDDVIAYWPGCACGSSRGPTDDGRKKPDIVAPGTDITSTNAYYETSSYFVEKSGTSMAAPHVSGAAAWFMDYGLSASEVKALLINTAEDKGDHGWDSAYGWGYLDLNHSYFHKDDVFSGTLNSNGKRFYKVTNINNEEKTTLVWQRHIENIFNSSSGYPLNNLDLYIYNESNNNLINSSTSAIDNVEQVESDSSYSSVIIKVKPAGSFSTIYKQEDYALATEEGSDEVTAPKLLTLLKLNGSCKVNAEDTRTVTVDIRNNGDIRAHNVQATLNLPSDFSLISGGNPQSIGIVDKNDVKKAIWTIQSSTSGKPFNISVSINSLSYGETFTEHGSIECSICPPADTDNNGKIDDFELLDYINKWTKGLVGDFCLLDAIDEWAKVTSSSYGVSSYTTTFKVYVNRTMPESADAGTSFTVNLNVDVAEDTKPSAIIIIDQIPSNWNVTSSAPAADYFDNGVVKWMFKESNVSDKNLSYTVKIPIDEEGNISRIRGQVLYKDQDSDVAISTAGNSEIEVKPSGTSGCNPPATGNWTVNQFTRCWYQSISVQIGKSLLLYNNLSLENTNLTTSRIVFRNASKITLKNSKIILKSA